ncbi:hypothetical protein FA95DRAFT_1416913 [Auriscalpium vulgare]|uniref:Uncharacterized protein n=1 Tax=Auriscalpium vulgare TaxID=40419 RepID=A0ACB8R0P2_9AGAM|nr:hypothetical protein FA95DRAFT_1416913 [Auriscalpium vulgare]
MMKEMAEELKQLPTQKVQMVLENEEKSRGRERWCNGGPRRKARSIRSNSSQIQPTTYCLTHIELSSSSALANIPCFFVQVKIVLFQRVMASDLYPSVTSRGNASPRMQISTSRRHFRSLNYRQTAKHLPMRSPFRRFRRQVHDLIVPLKVSALPPPSPLLHNSCRLRLTSSRITNLETVKATEHGRWL